ncbi:GntR family transcriptional regulator [Leucobacter exalbidus]|uniref:GntR family transcriptional regulator n=1 Tax=Leucobacter exalbidus TaxID=662960 RepID=A0A940PN35_9MICO|nr:GntR family transcriptional regulator [Leucobacter exalbidus]MBP1326110.1 GntR family transcriptional regulator [Leucobacter exalbidus]
MTMTMAAPLHSQLYEEMLLRIRTGAWPAGEKVPSERSLIAEFGTSRGPVRQALATLRAEGMIVGGRGAPPRVHRSAPHQSFDTFMSFTEWARGLGLVPGQRVIERVRRPATEEMARELQIAPDAPVVEIIRLRLLGDKPAMLERSLFPFEVGKHLLQSPLECGSIYQTLARVGVVPVRAKHVIDAIPAHPLEAEQLHINQGTPLLRVRRLTYGASQSIIETTDDRYLPEMTSFVVENNTDQRMPLARHAVGV